MDKKFNKNLLLLGKTGNGKSATGNSILHRKVFKSIGSATAVTTKIDWDVAEINGSVIKVVDAPGIYDNSKDKSEAVSFVLNCLQEAIALSPEGYHAFLLVIKFGNRFTGEEQATINFLKNAFGQNFVKEYCVLVMSGGDMFKGSALNISFTEWCREQTGQFQDLLQECGGRIVLFDNFLKDDNEKSRQLLQLIDNLNQLPNKDKPYTDENFNMVKEKRDQLRLEAKEPIIRQEVLSETSLLIDGLDKLQRIEVCQSKTEPLKKLLTRDQSLVKFIKDHEKKNMGLQDLLDIAESLGITISNEMHLNNKIKEELENQAQKRKAVKQIEAMLPLQLKNAKHTQKQNKKKEADNEQLKLDINKAKAESERINGILEELRIEQKIQRERTEQLERKYLDSKESLIGRLLGAIYSKMVIPIWSKFKNWCKSS